MRSDADPRAFQIQQTLTRPLLSTLICRKLSRIPLLITPQVFGDDRGWFYESWNQRKFDEGVGESVLFSQDNHSRSIQGVLRGLHYQLAPEPQAKLVRATVGAIYDVAVDIRRHSPTFGAWGGAELSAECLRQLSCLS